jgi:hypothetical protein
VFRNEVVSTTSGVHRKTLEGLVSPLATATDSLEGEFLAIGDLDGNGTVEFAITRDRTQGATAPRTHAVTIWK